MLANQQVITLYDLGMSPEEIAGDMQLDVVAVKAALLQGSPKFRALAKEEPNLAFSLDEQELAKRVIADIATGSDDDYLRLRAARYIHDDSKGRLDPVGAQNLKINVAIFNQFLEKSEEAIKLAKAKCATPKQLQTT